MLSKIQNFFRKNVPVKPITLFFIISICSTGLFFLVLPFLGKHGLDWIVMENNAHFESADYFLCLLFSLGRNHVYQFGIDACYSPLSYGFFYLISKMAYLDDLLKNVDLLSIPYEELINMTTKLLSSPYQLLVFIIYSLTGILLYLLAIDELTISRCQKRLLSVIVIFSVPMLFGAVERGNLTLYVAGLVLIAAKLKDASSPVKREIALVLIAISAGLKFYPAFMGILYLKEHRFKEAFRLIFYGVICVFVPFAFFGGWSGMQQLLSNLSSLAAQSNYAYRIQFFQGILSTFGIHGFLNQLLNTAFLCILLILIMWTKNKTRMMTYLAATLAFYPPNAYRYTLLFFLLPLFAWLEEESECCTFSNYITAGLFSFIFSIPTIFGLVTRFHLNFNLYTLSYAEVFIYVAAWLLLALQMLRDICSFIGCHRAGTVHNHQNR